MFKKEIFGGAENLCGSGKSVLENPYKQENEPLDTTKMENFLIS
jgi:hypothetical protein